MNLLSSKRNTTVDFLRGIAMLMVVLGHTLTGSMKNAEQSLVYNIIWAIQMPLFVVISGYVTKYSKPISDIKELWKVVKKRTFSYMFPWLVWTIIIRGIIFSQKSFLNLKWLVFHMDSGYWFLFTIWIISIIYCLSDYFTNKTKTVGVWKFIVFTSIYLCFLVVVLIVGYLGGLSLLGSKLTLYYLPFYYCGAMFGRYQYKFDNKQRIKDLFISIATISFVFIILRIHLFDLADTPKDVILRVCASLTGCIALCGLLGPLYKNKAKAFAGVVYIGTHSIEIYLTHYLFLTPLNYIANGKFEIIIIPIINFGLTVLLCTVSIVLLEQNKILAKFLYGKDI